MTAIAAEEVDEFGLGPMDCSVLWFLKEHRSIVRCLGRVFNARFNRWTYTLNVYSNLPMPCIKRRKMAFNWP
nr:hypothetical protein CFP56_39769 [Quercus suber]